MLPITAPIVVSISTTQHAAVLPAGTTFNVTVQSPIDSTTAQVGDTIVLVANDPSYPTLRDAKITAHITSVRSATNMRPASIGFLFDTITFGNGKKEQFRGYVVNPRVTQVNHSSTPPPAMMAPPNQNNYFAPSSNTIVWQRDLGKQKTQTSATGGHGYSTGAGKPIHVASGTPAKLQLASDLQTP